MIIWITGASSGLGRYTAEAMVSGGHQVVCGARSFPARGVEGAVCLPLDVTDETSITAFVRDAENAYGMPDAVIHAAGILMLGSCEETLPEEYQRIMDTDFFGMVRVNRQVLPLLRKRGQGKVVMFSSINGLLGIPFQSAYTAAKHAVEGYAESLAQETKAFGIQVCLVEPGDHRGGSNAYRGHTKGMGKDSPYAAAFASGTAQIAHDESHGSDPAVLGKKLEKIIRRKHLPFRICIASMDQHLACWLHRLAPAGLNNMILEKYYIKKK